MMNKYFAAAVLVLLLVLLTVGVTLADDAPPSTSGPYVLRVDGGFFIVWGDTDLGMSLWVGMDPSEFCSGTLDVDILSIQVISVPEDLDRIIVSGRGNEYGASLWPTSLLPFPPHEARCELYLSMEPLATGTAKLRLTDNDLLGLREPNMNAYGRMVQGRLTTPEGDSLQVNAFVRSMHSPDDLILLVWCLNVTPWLGADPDNVPFCGPYPITS